MKEHFNLDTISNPKNWVDAPNKRGMATSKNKPENQTGIKEDTLLNASDDLFDSSIKGQKGFDESLIDGMDFAAALENLNFIKDQSSQSEGRFIMSNSHHSISPQKVMQLFA
jgi:hypothetical protein